MLHYAVKQIKSVLLSLCTLAFCISAHATDIQGLRFGLVDKNGAQATRMVIETAQPARAKLILLENPYRVVVDISDGEWAVSSLPPQMDVGVGVAQQFRFGHPEAGLGRVVLSLSVPATPIDTFSLPPSTAGTKAKYRIVIDLQQVNDTQFVIAKSSINTNPILFQPSATASSAPAKNLAPKPDVKVIQAPMSKPVPQAAARQTTTIVAIDAGHGGKDPGAIGLKGTKEKHITLRAAKMLAEELEKSSNIKPILIRSDDVYYKLRERTRRAAQQNADIFISLHADSAPNKKAHGISVFTLSEKASDKEAALLAKNENKSDQIGAPDATFEDPIVLDAFLGMRQRETKNESSKLANAMIENITSFPGSDKRGHRFAGFAVLKSAEIPSVLVEMGFLSNHGDEKNLNDKAYLRQLVKALAAAIEQYVEK